MHRYVKSVSVKAPVVIKSAVCGCLRRRRSVGAIIILNIKWYILREMWSAMVVGVPSKYR